MYYRFKRPASSPLLVLENPSLTKKINSKIAIYTLYNQIALTSEQIILLGLFDKSTDERFNIEIIENCRKYFTYVKTPEECDILVLPYKFKNINDDIYKNLNSISIKLNKPLLCFYNDDDDKKCDITSNVVFFRTSFYKKSKLKNEYAMPTFTYDYFNHKYLDENELSIGYCGHILHGRDKYLSVIKQSNIKHTFILRKGFNASGVERSLAIKEYISNIENNLFTFCYRGAGNFSYRFYETLMMGRIPVLINTDCVFPFDDNIDVNTMALIINEELLDNPNDLIEHIFNYYTNNKHKFLDMQKNNRKIWEKYFSPRGFLKNIYINMRSEWSLDEESFEYKMLEINKIWNLPSKINYYSQQDEDKYIIQYLLKDKITDGTFLEIGAFDGLTYSNTKTLEDYFNFSGILIEPQAKYYLNLKHNRSSSKNEIYNYAVSNMDDEFIDFIGDNACGGICNSINTDVTKQKNWKSYKVKNLKMKEILRNSRFSYIDFMIIDVEGSELTLLESIDFSFPIFCIIIEAHSNEIEKNIAFGAYLTQNGFKFKERQRGNEIWFNHTYFRAHLFNILY